MSQNLITPLLILRLAALRLGAELGDRLAREALDAEHRGGVGIPSPSRHG
jgi:hypothetical protein